jgi:hypothetical protein
MIAVEEIATFAAVWATLAAGHNVADHVFGQTDWQAARKGAPSPAEVAGGVSPRRGWAACLAHVAQYHLVLGVLLTVVWAVLDLPLGWVGVSAGLAVSVGTHALLDRRWPVIWLLEHTGKAQFARLSAGGLNGPYAADQALHGLALVSAALLMATLS